MSPVDRKVSRFGRWIAAMGRGSGQQPGMPTDSATSAGKPTHRRFLPDSTRVAESYLDAARKYMSKMSGFELEWLYRKPYDPRSGNEQFFLQAYAVMNLIQTMKIPQVGRVLEVGSGPGWVSELLMLLGYEVDGIEPCEELVAVANERIHNAVRHYRIAEPPRVEFHVTTLEGSELAPEAFDAVLFHDALHHVIDEKAAMERCFRCLKPGGVLGISEDAWRPGNRMQESALEKEMNRFGTHESPFTQEYLDDLLTRHGFVDIERYHAVNGFFPSEMGRVSLAEAADSPASRTNNLTARKPSLKGPSTVDFEASTRAKIEIVEKTFHETDRRIHLRIRLANIGATVWLHRQRKSGWVTLAVRTENLGAPDCREALPRHKLTENILPGEHLMLELDFYLPEGFERDRWYLDLVNEGLFWFSERGTDPAPVEFDRSST
jgi:SAM-dependent methyltransferase